MDGISHPPRRTALSRWQRGRAEARAACYRRGFAIFALLLGLGTVAGADFVLSDQDSDVYYRFAVVAGGDVKVDRDSEVTGNLHSNDKVDLKKETLVDGDVSAVGEVKNKGTVTGTITGGADPVALPALLTEEEMRALADRVFEGDTTLAGEIIDDVVFVAGNVTIEGDLNGTGTLLTICDIRFGGGDSDSDSDSDSDGGCGGGSDSDSGGDSDSDSGGDSDSDSGSGDPPIALDDATRLSLVSLKDVRFDQDRPFRGVVHAGGDVKLAKDARFEGALAAGGKVKVKKNARLTFLAPDLEPPAITNLLPAADAVLQEPTPNVGATYADDASGVDPSSVTLVLDGVDRTSEATVTATGAVFVPATALALGAHQVEVSVADRASNTAQASWSFTLVSDPELVVEHPPDGLFTNQSTVEFSGTVTGGGPIASVLINGQAAILDGQSFSMTLPLENDFTAVLVVATDVFGSRDIAGLGLYLDTEAPALELFAPEPGQLVNGDSVRVTGEIVDLTGVGTVIVDGVPVPVADNLFTADVELQEEGPKTILVEAVDRAGNHAETSVDVVRFTLPEVALTAPADLAIVAATTLPVAGTVSDDVVSVEVNGVPATLSGTSFTAGGIALIEGGNTITATAANAAGRVATATIHIVRDLTPPRVTIHRPLDRSRTGERTISVSGLVNDVVPGTVNSSEATVTVNGMIAKVVNRSFLIEDVPLLPGANGVVAEAVDAVGNVGADQIAVTRDDGPFPRVRAVSGNHQTGTIGAVLPEPLVAELLDAGGQPVAGTPVIFRLRGNDGSLDGDKRQMAVVTDAAGRAQATFALGRRAGVGNQVVEASAAGFAGPAAFLASAQPGEAALVVVDAGGQQVGVAGRQVPRPLIAAVVDGGNNRLAGVPLRFLVIEGQGHFADGSQQAVVTTDSDGRAIVSYLLDAAEGIGNNTVNAAIVGREDGYSANFIASSRAAGDPAATSVSGVVLDNTNLAVAGATLRIRDTGLTAVSDAEGQFRIDGAPVGAVDLIVDGSTVDRPGAWPDLEFDLVTIAGRANTVNMPIYLLPLDLENGIFVDETRGGTLTMEKIPGFALEVEAGSVTFPGGSRSGQLSVTVVHNDKVPMTPNFGQQPRLIVTIQPAGARFQPPARLTLPNAEGLAAGEVTEMYSFDHDLGHFVSIGSATVSDDATMVRSDPGVGVVKAGWHCGGNPAQGICVHECPECAECIDPPCKCQATEICSDCEEEGSACDGDANCTKGRQLIPKICQESIPDPPLPPEPPPEPPEDDSPRLGFAESDTREHFCEDLDEFKGVPGICGIAFGTTFDEVTHKCDNISLGGAFWTEELTSDQGCGGPPEIRSAIVGVRKDNRLVWQGFHLRDYVYVCLEDEEVSADEPCTEIWTQKIFLDECHVATHKYVFVLGWDTVDGEAVCAGVVGRN